MPSAKSRETELLELLEARFDAIEWGWAHPNTGGLEPIDVGAYLDIPSEAAEALCHAGMLESTEGPSGQPHVTMAEVLRFIEAHGDWWFARRAKRKAASLRTWVEEAEASGAPS